MEKWPPFRICHYKFFKSYTEFDFNDLERPLSFILNLIRRIIDKWAPFWIHHLEVSKSDAVYSNSIPIKTIKKYFWAPENYILLFRGNWEKAKKINKVQKQLGCYEHLDLLPINIIQEFFCSIVMKWVLSVCIFLWWVRCESSFLNPSKNKLIEFTHNFSFIELIQINSTIHFGVLQYE